MEEKSIAAADAGVDILPQYKKTAFLVSTYFMLILVLRYVAVLIISAFVSGFRDSLQYDILYILELTISGLFLQVLPSVLGAFMFGYIGKNSRGIRCLYTVPKSNRRAISDVTAVYGIGQVFNLLTIIVIYFITSKADFIRRLNTVAESSPGIAGAWFMFFMLVVIAPVFEEFIFRGVILNALRPYGMGFAVFVSGISFGLYHGNFQQCFFTAACGIAMAYIAYVTNSVLPTTIIHAIMNSLAGIIQLLIVTDPVQKYIIHGDGSEIPDSEMLWVAVYGIYMICLVIFIAVSIIMAVIKLKQVLRHRQPKVWGEVSNKRKTAILLTTVPALIAIVMLVDVFGGFSVTLLKSVFGV